MVYHWHHNALAAMMSLLATGAWSPVTSSEALPSWDAVQQQTTPVFAGRGSSSATRRRPPPRRLQNDDDNYEWDISDFSLRFGKCQHVKTFDDEIAQEGETVLALKSFVVYRLCPSDECDECDGVYGEYVTTVDSYLQATAAYWEDHFEDYCDGCEEECNDDGSDCDGCALECWKYQNMQKNGYVDASQYIECQELDVGGDDDDFALYIGPRCSSDGTRIVIDLFMDENCWEVYGDRDVEDVLGMDVSYHLMKNTYSSDGDDCVSCMEDANNADDADQQDADDVAQMCENIYTTSAKCESIHGLENGFINMNREEEDYENQVENEFMVCTFISSLVWDSYTETGEINIFEDQDAIVRQTTTMQKVWLSILSAAMVGLGVYAAYLHRKIRMGYPNLGISCQGGTMA